MKHIKVIKACGLEKKAGCGECQSSCQSACKTSCTVANQSCERKEQ
ncbi:MAG: six-cysteine ranthipeptide SCIFF [Clostridia bacterium]|nr:six-cysteine ranthipeptide SCIFF [Clostridia bacterium]